MIWGISILRLGFSSRWKIRSARKCYLCDRYVVLPMSPGRTLEKWRAQGDDFRTFLADFLAGMQQIEFPAGLNW